MRATPLLLTARGIAVFAVIGVITAVAVLGLVLVPLLTSPGEGEPDQIDYEKAAFLNQAGLEYAMRRLYRGESPVTGEIRLGEGTFRVARRGEALTVMSQVRQAAVTHRVSQPAQADCLAIDTSESHTHDRGREVRRIYLDKTCLESIVLDRMILVWEPDLGEAYDQVRAAGLPNNDLYEAPPRVRSGQLIDLKDAPLVHNQRYKLEGIRFPSDMRQKSFHLKFFLADGSSRDVRFTLARCPHSSC